MTKTIKYHIYEETYVDPQTAALTRRFKGHVVVQCWMQEKRVKITAPTMGLTRSIDQMKMVYLRAFNDFDLPLYVGYVKTNGSLPWSLSVGDRQVLYFQHDIMIILKPDGTARLMQSDAGMTYQEQMVDLKIKPPSPLRLTVKDWAEIYYALDDKLKKGASVQGGGLPIFQHRFHIEQILNGIGPDGKEAVRLGVAPADLSW